MRPPCRGQIHGGAARSRLFRRRRHWADHQDLVHLHRRQQPRRPRHHLRRTGRAYSEQIRGLLDGGADVLLVETIFDTLNAKAAFFAIQKIFEERDLKPLPYSAALTSTLDPSRTRRSSPSSLRSRSSRPAAIAASPARPSKRSGIPSRNVPLLSVGMNCALGPKEMRPLIEELSNVAPIYSSAYPNAGLPNPLLPTGFPETPESLAPQLQRLGGKRLAEHRRRLLRHHPGAHQSDRRSGARSAPGKVPLPSRSCA